jgi:hypothetical protein
VTKAAVEHKRHPLSADEEQRWHAHESAYLQAQLAEIQSEKQHAQLIFDSAAYTLRGDPDATEEDRREAKVQEACAASGIAQLDAEQDEIEGQIEQLGSMPRPVRRPTPLRRAAPIFPFSRRSFASARPRERRARRRSRSSSSTDPSGSTSDGDPEPNLTKATASTRRGGSLAAGPGRRAS